jgi:hypothetical protein
MCLVRQDAAARAADQRADIAARALRRIDEETRATEQRTNLKRLRDAAHARGSAEAMREYLNAISPTMILSHAERLASLIQRTPAYTQCVELTARDIES